MRGFRFVLPALFCCCLLFAVAPAFADAPTAAPASVLTSAPDNVLPPDSFLDGAVTTSASAVCIECDPNVEDNCVGQPNHGPCNNGAPNCHCKKCNNDFRCWHD